MIAPLFVSHGSPTLLIDDVPARDFLRAIGQTLPRPKAIVAVSAHWETRSPEVSAMNVNQTIHDFGGFPDLLYQMRYDAPGDPALAARIQSLLGAAGLPAALNPQRGLDHGAWVPLKLAWPEADIPVVQVSLQTHLGPAHHYQLGQTLAPLTADGILVLGSGSFTHDLRSVVWRGPNAAPGWVTEFADWVTAALAERRIDDLLNYRTLAPHAARNHPTEEHFLPLFVALGAGGRAATALHRSLTFSVLRMDAFEFSV